MSESRGSAVLAAQALGAEGVQIGTLFAVTQESSASDAFKERCLQVGEGDTMLCLKKISPTRMIKNELFQRIAAAEDRGANADELREILGKAASKRGIFEGDIENGEVEIGQIVSAINNVKTVDEVFADLLRDYDEALQRVDYQR